MNFTNLYKQGIDLWPTEINIGDGYPTGKDGFVFPSLTTIHDEIENKLDTEDGWAQIIVWSLFQAFHTESKALITHSEKTLKTRNIKLSEIEWRVLQNIQGEGWEDLLSEYVNDLQKNITRRSKRTNNP